MSKEQIECIPYGIYCYELLEVKKDKNGVPNLKVSMCPYWSMDRSKPDQMNGYCAYLDRGDWDGEGLGLLFDQIKECGINEGLDKE